MKSKFLARLNVALKTCQLLQDAGECHTPFALSQNAKSFAYTLYTYTQP